MGQYTCLTPNSGSANGCTPLLGYSSYTYYYPTIDHLYAGYNDESYTGPERWVTYLHLPTLSHYIHGLQSTHRISLTKGPLNI